MVMAVLRLWAYPWRITGYARRRYPLGESTPTAKDSSVVSAYDDFLCDIHIAIKAICRIRLTCVAGDSKSLQKKISAELRGLACRHVAWMAAMGVMRHTSDGR